MGKCWNCKKDILLGDEEVTCDNCNEIINYCCWRCKEWFSAFDDETEKKRNECSVCGFFICPNCNSCGDACKSINWFNNINKILNINNQYNVDYIVLNNIINYIKKIKMRKENRNCPRGVPISYAKGNNARIKEIRARMEGYKIKSDDDEKRFKERLEKVKGKEIGEEFFVDDAREPGHYGQEYRDIFNFCVCLGHLECLKYKRKDDNGKEIECSKFKRCNGKQCQYFNKEKVVIKKCPVCKKAFPIESEFCDECKQKGNGRNHNKGDPIELKIKKTNVDVCQLLRNNFLTKKEENGEEKINI